MIRPAPDFPEGEGLTLSMPKNTQKWECAGLDMPEIYTTAEHGNQVGTPPRMVTRARWLCTPGSGARGVNGTMDLPSTHVHRCSWDK